LKSKISTIVLWTILLSSKNNAREKHKLFPLCGRKTSFAKSLLFSLAQKFFSFMCGGEVRRLEDTKYEENEHKLESCRRDNSNVQMQRN